MKIVLLLLLLWMPVETSGASCISTTASISGVSDFSSISSCDSLQSLLIAWGPQPYYTDNLNQRWVFNALTRVTGNVIIRTVGTGSIRNIQFPSLVEIGGNLVIESTKAPNVIDGVLMDKLALVGGNITIGGPTHAGVASNIVLAPNIRTSSLDVQGRITISTPVGSGQLGNITFQNIHHVNSAATGANRGTALEISGAFPLGLVAFNTLLFPETVLAFNGNIVVNRGANFLGLLAINVRTINGDLTVTATGSGTVLDNIKFFGTNFVDFSVYGNVAMASTAASAYVRGVQLTNLFSITGNVTLGQNANAGNTFNTVAVSSGSAIDSCSGRGILGAGGTCNCWFPHSGVTCERAELRKICALDSVLWRDGQFAPEADGTVINVIESTPGASLIIKQNSVTRGVLPYWTLSYKTNTGETILYRSAGYPALRTLPPASGWYLWNMATSSASSSLSFSSSQISPLILYQDTSCPILCPMCSGTPDFCRPFFSFLYTSGYPCTSADIFGNCQNGYVMCKESAPCGSGLYQPAPDNPLCLPVSSCGPGKFISQVASPTSDTVCGSCQAGVNFQNRTNASSCTPCRACGDGLFTNTTCTTTSDATCSPCHSSCATCRSGTIIGCVTCAQGLFLRANGTCAITCPDGTFPSNGVCRSCDSTCRTCSASASTCTSCNTTSGRFLLNNMCLLSTDPQRPANTYKNFVSGTWEYCSTCLAGTFILSNCTENNNTVCRSCTQGANFTSAPNMLNCTPCATCPTSYVGGACSASQNTQCGACHSSCSTCVGPTEANCTACASPLSLQAGRCVSQCGDGTFSLSGVCRPCNSTCKTCSGGNADQCTSCETGTPSNRFLFEGRCLRSQDLNFTGIYYKDASLGVWRSCKVCVPGESLQSACSEFANTACKACAANTYSTTNNANTCLLCSSCSTYVTANCTLTSNTRCGTCASGCSACTGPSPTSCTNCIPTFELVNNTCSPKCGSGLYFNLSTCVPCNASCKECVNDASNCISCNTTQGRYLLNNTCLLSSQLQDSAKYYANNLTGTWTPCSSCQAGKYISAVCSLSSDTVCSNCIAGVNFTATSDRFGCFSCSSCASNMYIEQPCTASSNTVCRQCHSSCSMCNGPNPNQCTACPNTNVLSNGVCQNACPGNQYRSSNGSCLLCDSSCESCSAAGNSSCLSCNVDVGYLLDGMCRPPSSFNYLGNYYVDLPNKKWVACRVCPPGTFVRSVCNISQDTVCAPCTQGQSYSLQNNSMECKTCSSCSDGMYTSSECTTTQNTMCEGCDTTCKTCLGKGTNRCTACSPGLLFYQSSCLANCPSGSYLNSTSGDCSSCYSACAKCEGPFANNCTACEGGVSDDSLYLFDGYCLKRADFTRSNYYRNPKTGRWTQCTTCPAGSFTSSECNNFEDTKCTSCVLGSSFQPLSGQSSCFPVTSCPPGYFPEVSPTLTTDARCSPCPSGRYKAVNGNSSCIPWSEQCPSMEVETAGPTSTSDRNCSLLYNVTIRFPTANYSALIGSVNSTKEANFTSSLLVAIESAGLSTRSVKRVELKSGSIVATLFSVDSSFRANLLKTISSSILTVKGVSASNCPSGTFMLFNVATNNIDCLNVTSCTKSQYIVKMETFTSNRLCAACDPSCDTCNGPGPSKCVTCTNGVAYGSYCIDPCTLNICNGQPCVTLSTGYVCNCNKSYAGVNCENAVTPCSSFPCKNGGTCVLLNDSFTCNCPVGLNPPLCSSPTDLPNQQKDSSSKSSTMLGAVVGGVAGFILVVVLILALVWIRKRSPKSKTNPGTQSVTPYFQNPLFKKVGGTSGAMVIRNDSEQPLFHADSLFSPRYEVPLVSGSSSDMPSAKAGSLYEQPVTENPEYSSVTNSRRPNQKRAHGAAAMQALQIKRSSITMGRRLGGGEYGEVFDGTAEIPVTDGRLEQRQVAIKTLRQNSSSQDVEDFLAEIKLMKAIGAHPNVVSVHGFCTVGEPYLLVVELMANGNLRDYLINARPTATEGMKLSPSRLLKFGVDICTGMAFLASKGVVHRDLATRNVLVDSALTAKISDFGLAREMDDEQIYAAQTKKRRLPLKWLAPESIRFKSFTSESDVWSFGITLWEIIHLGLMPYPGISAAELPRKLIQEGYRMPRPDFCTRELYSIIDACWDQEPAHRPSFEELREKLVAMVSDAMAHLRFDKKTTASSFPIDFKRSEAKLTDSDRSCYTSNQDPSVRPSYEEPRSAGRPQDQASHTSVFNPSYVDLNDENRADTSAAHDYEYAPAPGKRLLLLDMSSPEDKRASYLQFEEL